MSYNYRILSLDASIVASWPDREDLAAGPHSPTHGPTACLCDACRGIVRNDGAPPIVPKNRAARRADEALARRRRRHEERG